MDLDQDDEEKFKRFSESAAGLDILSKLYEKQEANDKSDKQFKSFLPEPGFCLKTKHSNKETKVFINICQSKEINSPKDISEDELMKLIDSGDNDDGDEAAFRFRIPMSLGEAHEEIDNSGNAATVYDVCISSQFFAKINKISTFMGFFMSVVIEGLENKYSIKLDRQCKMLKNRKFMGKIQEQFIRTKSKPIIAEIGENNSSKVRNENDISNENRAQIPKYKIIREPPEGVTEFLVAEIELPNILSSNSLTLDIGEDRILLTTRSGLYYLDIFLPYNLKQEECGAQFDKKNKTLTITMPIANE